MAHTKEPWSVEEIDNDGDYGGGPNPRNGFMSFAVCDEDGNILFDSLNRDSAVSEVHEEDHADEDGHLYAWDDPAKRDARRIVACVNACRGVDIGVLESDGFPMQLAGILALKIQRDELLTALKGVINRLDLDAIDLREWLDPHRLGYTKPRVENAFNALYVPLIDAAKAAIAQAEGRS